MLIERTLFGTENKVENAIQILREHEPDDGYYLAFSGGKDSVVILRLAEMAGVKYQAYYNLTTVDPPELVHFIRKTYPDTIFEKPEKTMWKLIEDEGIPPTRFFRYCCRVLKEQGGIGRTVVTGVRWAESARRRTWGVKNALPKKTVINPILDWSDSDVWEFIHQENIPYCSLYDEGFSRLGCVLCPMKTLKGKLRDIERWPKIAESYKRAMVRAVATRKRKGKKTDKNFSTGENMFEWWIYGKGYYYKDSFFAGIVKDEKGGAK